MKGQFIGRGVLNNDKPYDCSETSLKPKCGPQRAFHKCLSTGEKKRLRRLQVEGKESR